MQIWSLSRGFDESYLLGMQSTSMVIYYWYFIVEFKSEIKSNLTYFLVVAFPPCQMQWLYQHDSIASLLCENRMHHMKVRLAPK